MVPRQRRSMVNLQTIHNTTLTETANLDYPLGNVRTALQVQETRLIAAIQSTKYLKRTTENVCHLKEVLFGTRQYTNTQSADCLSETYYYALSGLRCLCGAEIILFNGNTKSTDTL